MASARANTSPLHLLVLLLGVSHLIISMNAVPIPRTRSLVHVTYTPHVSTNTQFENVEKRWEIGAINRRMLVELNDYPGSGANNRHTPKPQVGRVCVDC